MSDDEPTLPALSDEQHRALARVIDEIIPPSDDGRLPGAGDAGVTHYIEAALRPTPMLTEMVVAGLSALDALARQRHARDFAALSRQEQSELLKALSSTEHAFPPVLMIHTYAGYYQSEPVMRALGLEPRPPHPAGYRMGPNDLSLLDPVRERPARYRAC